MADNPPLPPDQDAADEAARAVHAEGVAEATRNSELAEAELANVYGKASSDVQELIRARGDTLTRRKAANDVERVLEGAVLERARVIAVSIRSANKGGVAAARRTFDVVFGEERVRSQVRASSKALVEGSERIAGRTTVDGVGLVKRIKRHDVDTVQAIAREVDDVFRAGKGALDAADKIARLPGAVPVKLAKYQQELVDAVRGLDGLTASEAKAARSELGKLARKHMRYVETLGEMQADGSVQASAYSLRGPSKRFIQQIQKATGADIDRVIAKNMEERALYRARVIARHETNQAFDAAYVEQNKNKPGHVGFRWSTVGRHPRPDECDVYAAANYDDLGPGVYKADNLPTKHPMCLCAITSVVDLAHFDRPEDSPRIPQDFVDTESPDVHAWYAANRQRAVEVLGHKRVALMDEGHTVYDEHGAPLPIWQILGVRRAAE